MKNNYLSYSRMINSYIIFPAGKWSAKMKGCEKEKCPFCLLAYSSCQESLSVRRPNFVESAVRSIERIVLRDDNLQAGIFHTPITVPADLMTERELIGLLFELKKLQDVCQCSGMIDGPKINILTRHGISQNIFRLIKETNGGSYAQINMSYTLLFSEANEVERVGTSLLLSIDENIACCNIMEIPVFLIAELYLGEEPVLNRVKRYNSLFSITSTSYFLYRHGVTSIFEYDDEKQELQSVFGQALESSERYYYKQGHTLHFLVPKELHHNKKDLTLHIWKNEQENLPAISFELDEKNIRTRTEATEYYNPELHNN